MQVYLVGGAVRDGLLGREVRERDYVVVGADPDELLRAGYKAVGRDFPVFLHPETHFEYALARRERKTGPGYRGFVTDFSSDITLEEDLLRRDLTINAMAQRDDGSLIDPNGGRADLEARVLRHVSPAFSEDPVRILRVARFAARFAALGFKVHESTRELMRGMVAAGEVSALVPERVWQETERALGEPHPQVYFQVLRDCGALAVIFPEVDRLFGVPQPAQWHPEIDTGVHVMLCLQAGSGTGCAEHRALCVTGARPGQGHDATGAMAQAHHARVARTAAGGCPVRAAARAHRARGAGAHDLQAAHQCASRAGTATRDRADAAGGRDAFRRPERFSELLLACQCDAQGRTGLENSPYPQREYLEAARAAAGGCTAHGRRDVPVLRDLRLRRR